MAAKTLAQLTFESSALTSPPVVYNPHPGHLFSAVNHETVSVPPDEGHSLKTTFVSRKTLASQEGNTMRTNPKLVPVLDPVSHPVGQLQSDSRSSKMPRKGFSMD